MEEKDAEKAVANGEHDIHALFLLLLFMTLLLCYCLLQEFNQHVCVSPKNYFI